MGAEGCGHGANAAWRLAQPPPAKDLAVGCRAERELSKEEKHLVQQCGELRRDARRQRRRDGARRGTGRAVRRCGRRAVDGLHVMLQHEVREVERLHAQLVAAEHAPG